MAQKFPFTMWVYNPYSDFTPDEIDLWADCGMSHPMSPAVYNTEQVKELIPFLDRAQERGIKLIANCRHLGLPDYQKFDQSVLITEGPEAYEKLFREAYEIIGSHPALHGFYVADEPMRPQFFDAVTLCYEIQKKVAPELHPFVNLRAETPDFEPDEFRGKTYEEWIKYIGQDLGISFVTLDNYGPMINDNLIPGYFHAMKGAVETSMKVGGPEVWNNLLSSAHYAYTIPTENDIRWMINTSAACGCRGAMWFRFYDRVEGYDYYGSPIDEFGNKTENYYAILRCQNRFNNQFGELLMSLKFKKAFHLGIDYKVYPSFVDGSHDLIRLSNYDNAVVSFFEDENGVEYMCMVSMHRDRISSHKIFYDESKCKVHEMILNGKRVDYFPPTNPNELYGDFSFIPGQMRLFRIDRV